MSSISEEEREKRKKNWVQRHPVFAGSLTGLVALLGTSSILRDKWRREARRDMINDLQNGENPLASAIHEAARIEAQKPKVEADDGMPPVVSLTSVASGLIRDTKRRLTSGVPRVASRPPEAR